MQNPPVLYRKRFIPLETIHLKDDIILYHSENLIITKWHSLKPRLDIAHGISAYFIDRNFKLSKIFNPSNEFVYWYCDIIKTCKDVDNDAIIFEDLLIDIIIYENHFIKVMDMEEVADAHAAGLISLDMMYMALRAANDLLSIIYKGDFNQYMDIINRHALTSGL